LVLPQQRAFSTLQRVPWFADGVRPEVWLHDGESAHAAPVPSKRDTITALSDRLKEGQGLAEEQGKAATATYLGQRSSTVFELVEQPWSDHPRSVHPVIVGTAQRVTDTVNDAERQSLLPVILASLDTARPHHFLLAHRLRRCAWKARRATGAGDVRRVWEALLAEHAPLHRASAGFGAC
jgi:hypothetical protein